MAKKKVCPVCDEPYLHANLVADDMSGMITEDHYYHEREKILGGITHYRGLCVAGSFIKGVRQTKYRIRYKLDGQRHTAYRRSFKAARKVQRQLRKDGALEIIRDEVPLSTRRPKHGN